MQPYFQYLENYQYDKAVNDQIGQYCFDNFDKFERSSSRLTNKYGRYDYNYFLPAQYIPTELMNELGKHFKIDLTHEILGQDPFTDGKIHQDRIVPGLPPRISLIMFPVWPLNRDNIDPTNFYTLEKGSYQEYDDAVWKKRTSVDWSLGKPAILNLQEYHSAINLRSAKRFGAQFTTDKTFEEMVELYNNGELYATS